MLTSEKCDDFSILRASSQLTCQRSKGVPIFKLGVPTCQRRLNFSIWPVNLPKGVPIFQLFFKRIFQFLNFSLMLNICKFREYLGNFTQFISRNKEFKFWHLQKFIKEKPYQPKTFNVVFNGARRINKTTIGLVQSGAEYNFYLLNFTRRV